MKVRNYYRLKEGCGLRGWLFNPYSLVRDDWYAPVDLSAEEFNVLVRCDGETIFGDDEPENVRTILERYESEGIIKACGNLHPVSDAQRYRFYPCWRFDAVNWAITGRCKDYWIMDMMRYSSRLLRLRIKTNFTGIRLYLV